MGFRKNSPERRAESEKFEQRLELGMEALKAKLTEADKVLANLPKIPEYRLYAREIKSKRLVLDLMQDANANEIDPSIANADFKKLDGELTNLIAKLKKFEKRHQELKDVVGVKPHGIVKYTDGSSFAGFVAIKNSGEKVPYGKGVYTDRYGNKFEANFRFNTVEEGRGTLQLPSGAKAELWFKDGLNAKGVFFDEMGDPFALVIDKNEIRLMPILRGKLSTNFVRIDQVKIDSVADDAVLLNTRTGNYILTNNGLSTETPPVFGENPKEHKSYYGVARFKDYELKQEEMIADNSEKIERAGISNLDKLAKVIKTKNRLG